MIVTYERPSSTAEALAFDPASHCYLAGGTDLIPLMRADPGRMWHLIDLRDAGIPNGVRLDDDRLSIGAGTTLAALAADPLVAVHAPALTQAALASASPQVRNLATIAGNLLQRTRCSFFRDPLFPCNKRTIGSGCPALASDRRRHAIVGGGPSCIAVNASDCAVALVAHEARVHLRSRDASRVVALTDFYLCPGDSPSRETVLRPGELVTSIDLRPAPNSAYVKVRDRASFEFALVSAAVVRTRHRRTHRWSVAIGAVAPVPWPAPFVARALSRSRTDSDAIAAALRHREFSDAIDPAYWWKIDLAAGAIARAAALATEAG